MLLTPEKQNLSSRVLTTEPSNWKEFQYIQQDDFKDLPDEARKKLKASILENNFTQPFYVWREPSTGIVFCLDGRHRTMLLEELVKEGYTIPDQLPATFIDCADKKEAAKLVLVYSSIYARITQQGLFDFVDQYDLNLEQMNQVIDLPWMKFMDNPETVPDVFDDAGIGVKNQYGVIVLCKSEEDQQKIFEKLSTEGYECKVVVT